MKKYKILIIALFLATYFLPWRTLAAGAYLTVSPGSGNFSVGQTVKAQIMVQANGNQINAVAGTITYPTDLLEAIGITKGSTFNFWQTSPSENNGNIIFATGRTGSVNSLSNIFTVSFKIKKEGTARIGIANDSILLADGEGTNVGSAPVGAVWNLKQSENKPLPPKPEIYSTTNPDSNFWYNAEVPEMQWKLPRNIIGIYTSIDTDPVGKPKAKSLPAENYKAANLNDGSYYFHLAFENNNGIGPAATYNFKKDTTPPVLTEFKPHEVFETVQKYLGFDITAQDSESGVGHIKAKINEGEWLSINSFSGKTYLLPKLSSGQYTIRFAVGDKAGNETYKDYSITIVSALKVIPYFIWIVIFILVIMNLIQGIVLFRNRETKKKAKRAKS